MFNHWTCLCNYFLKQLLENKLKQQLKDVILKLFFLFSRTENRKQFLVTKYIFLIFYSKEQKTALKNNCQTCP